MTDENISNPKIGLLVGTKAPLFETKDINDNEINLSNLLKGDYRGILIDFFRGAW
jgi:peroxiredoxin